MNIAITSDLHELGYARRLLVHVIWLSPLLLDEELNINLATISTAGSHRTVIFDLIKWAIAKGHIADLILTLARDTRNQDIQRFCGCVLRQHLSLNVSDSSIVESPLNFEPAAWGLDVSYEELQSLTMYYTGRDSIS